MEFPFAEVGRLRRSSFGREKSERIFGAVKFEVHVRHLSRPLFKWDRHSGRGLS